MGGGHRVAILAGRDVAPSWLTGAGSPCRPTQSINQPLRRILLVDGDSRVAILARQDLAPGDELFYNYNYDKRVGSAALRCAALRCADRRRKGSRRAASDCAGADARFPAAAAPRPRPFVPPFLSPPCGREVGRFG